MLPRAPVPRGGGEVQSATDTSVPIAVSVVGASGYTGAELVRLLLAHPQVRLASVHGHETAGQALATVLPSLLGRTALQVQPVDPEAIARHAKAVFCALPHGKGAAIVDALRQHGAVVFDLSADFRLRQADTYAQWYGAHAAPQRLGEAVYGLAELHREALRSADLVAVAGCYPTASLLALAPLLHAGLIEPAGIIIDAKSGVTGAGRAPSASTHFSEVNGGLRAYKVGGQHRHIAEIEEQLALLAGQPVTLTFTPHLAPMSRGILATVYARPANVGLRADTCRQTAQAFYAGSPSVHVLIDDRNPDTLWVQGSNRAMLSYQVDERSGQVIAQATIDNLVKGAAGQAIQCFNLRFGLEEGAGLNGTAAWP